LNKGSILILGARSDIGKAVAHRFAALGYSIQLAARNAGSLEPDKADIKVRHNVDVDLFEFDALDLDSHQAFATGLPVLPDVIVCAVGMLGDQAADEKDEMAACKVMRSNYEGPASIFSVFANLFEKRGSGTLVGISSVAGERGRAANYVYGSAKAGFTAYLSGLRNRLAAKGVHVITVLPGFVATQMTEGLDLPQKLTAEPEEVAAAIEKAVGKGSNVIYVRRIWQLIMMIIRNIPEAVFKRMSI